jgi:hypothetical protein
MVFLDTLATLQSARYLRSVCLTVLTHEDVENGWKNVCQSFYCCLRFATFLFGLLLDIEDGGGIFLRKVGLFSTNTMFQPRTAHSS